MSDKVLRQFRVVVGQHHELDGKSYFAGEPGKDIVATTEDYITLFPNKFVEVIPGQSGTPGGPTAIAIDVTGAFPGAAQLAYKVFALPDGSGFNISEEDTPTVPINPKPATAAEIATYIAGIESNAPRTPVPPETK